MKSTASSNIFLNHSQHAEPGCTIFVAMHNNSRGNARNFKDFTIHR